MLLDSSQRICFPLRFASCLLIFSDAVCYNGFPGGPANLSMGSCDMPAQPLLMATGLLVIVGGFISPALGQLMGWLAWPCLAWTTGVIDIADAR